VKLLIVDDEAPVVDFLDGAARAFGVEEVDTAASGEDALGKVIRADYDLITLDIRMPGATGLEILSVLRNMCPHAIIAVVSGHIPPDLDAETAASADVMMVKPIHLEAVGALVEAARKIREARESVREMSTFAVATS